MTRTKTRGESPAQVLLAAITEHPNATATELAERTGMGRSTATKALAALADTGKVRRQAGGRDGARRLPDRWSIPTTGAGSVPNGKTWQAVSPGDSDRLGKGELAKLVLAHLRAHPGEHSPTAVANALDGRSSGAVGNALDRLVADGHAVQTCPKPRRYQASQR